MRAGNDTERFGISTCILSRLKILLFLLIVETVATTIRPGVQARESSLAGNWVATWSAATQSPLGAAPVFENHTLRQVARVTIGGRFLRIRFSNANGTTPFIVGAASVGIRDRGADIAEGTLRSLTFAGASSITIPPGAIAISDAVHLPLEPQADLAISLYVPVASPATTTLAFAHRTSFVAANGDFTKRASMPVAATITSYFWLAGVEVLADQASRAIVTLGDSITEGYASTLDANARWPDHLASRLLAHPATRHLAVLNAGISLNRVLNEQIGPNAQSRLDRDALTQSGAAFIILQEGINDIGFPQIPPSQLPPGILATSVSADDITAGYQQIIRRAHAQGIEVYGATLLPFAGAFYYATEAETKRQAVNQWIRESGAFDAVIDFDEVMRDPNDRARLNPAYDSGDHLHPNDTGYAAMAESIDMSLFTRRQRR